MLLAAIQLGVPLLLTIWLRFWPSRNRFVLTLQFVAIVALMIAIWTAGIWTLVPRWSLAVIAFFALVAAVRGARRPTSPFGGWMWVQTFVSLALLAAGGFAIAEAWRAHQPPSIASIRLASPLDGNDIVVANGGSKLLLNAHQDTLDLSVPRHRLWHGQSYGVDLVALTPVGMTSDGFRPTDPARYVIFGRAVRAPCAGRVITITDGRPDLEIPKVDPKVMEGNHIRLGCGDVEIVLAHLKRGSLKVRIGDQVSRGQALAAVGNSGMSDEPHLHIHAQTPGTAQAPFSGKPVAMFFNGRFLARNDRI
jgi:Peptidase family M23